MGSHSESKMHLNWIINYNKNKTKKSQGKKWDKFFITWSEKP